MTQSSESRLAIARLIADAHSALPGYAASFLTGSSAEGIADDQSDIDMSIFFNDFPQESELWRVKNALDPKPHKWMLGSFPEEEIALSIEVEGIEAQFCVSTIAKMDSYVDRIVAGELGTSPEIKIAIGTLIAVPLHGEQLIRAWQNRLRTYPDSYRESTLDSFMCQRKLEELYPKLVARNAEIWVRRELSERTYSLLAALAALNRVWFSEFQFKRSDIWCASLAIAPPNLAERARSIAELPLLVAVEVAIDLFAETRDLVSVHR